jgi:hypothetical protein
MNDYHEYIVIVLALTISTSAVTNLRESLLCDTCYGADHAIG